MSTRAEPAVATPKALSAPPDCTIVIVAPFPPPWGGMTLQANQLFQLLLQERVKVKRIDTNQKFSGRWSFLERMPGLRTIAHWALFARQVWRAARPQTILHIFANSYASFFLWTGTATVIGRRRGAAIIINYRGGLAHEFLEKWRKSTAFIFRRANKIIVPSRYLEFVFLQNQISSQIIPNIIRHDLPQRLPREMKIPHLVVNRNFEAIYNVPCALRAFALVQAVTPEAKLTLIGDGPLRCELENLVRKLGLQNVRFTGKLRNQDVMQTLCDCDIMLNPTDVDNMPNSVIEAMALGIPVVSTNAGGVPYLLQHGRSGILIEKNNHRAMARAALRLIRSSTLRQRLIKNAQHVVEDFHWEKVWPQWRALYQSLL